jgi:hypothetical protein
MLSLTGLGPKNRNFRGFSPGKEVPKTIFGLCWQNLPHNLGLEKNAYDAVRDDQ